MVLAQLAISERRLPVGPGQDTSAGGPGQAGSTGQCSIRRRYGAASGNRPGQQGCALFTGAWDTAGDGHPGQATGSRFGNPFMWTGQRYDAPTGLYHFLFRSYSPALGRWLQRDPLGYVDGPNAYGYVTNNPLRYTDPLGLQEAGGQAASVGVYIGKQLTKIVALIAAAQAAHDRAALQRAINKLEIFIRDSLVWQR